MRAEIFFCTLYTGRISSTTLRNIFCLCIHLQEKFVYPAPLGYSVPIDPFCLRTEWWITTAIFMWTTLKNEIEVGLNVFTEHCKQYNIQRSDYYLPGMIGSDTSLTSPYGRSAILNLEEHGLQAFLCRSSESPLTFCSVVFERQLAWNKSAFS
jgi:hypothetical protein